jgi:ubiquinone/menaquinone biosynthesis C-methylase UbiE
MEADKRTELERYRGRARSLLAEVPANRSLGMGSDVIPPIYRAPYLCYELHARRLIRPHQVVLELGAGTGAHTTALTQTGAEVIATDISYDALRVLAAEALPGAAVVAADMESLPFADESFDLVACAGSLSYADPDGLDAEIRRVLRPGGALLCVDSLNHNPIYRLNRWVHFKRGQRTQRTLRYMPTELRLARIAAGFEKASIEYFGCATFLMPAVAGAFGQNVAARVSDVLDHLVRPRRSAFKFVLAAEGKR